MTSRFDEIQNALGSPMALQFQGESVTHWPLGVSTSASPERAIVNLDQAEKDTKGGTRFATSGRIRVSSSLSLSDSDAWVIRDVTYQVVVVGKPQGGLTEIEIKHVQKKHTTLNRRTEY